MRFFSDRNFNTAFSGIFERILDQAVHNDIKQMLIENRTHRLSRIRCNINNELQPFPFGFTAVLLGALHNGAIDISVMNKSALLYIIQERLDRSMDCVGGTFPANCFLLEIQGNDLTRTRILTRFSQSRSFANLHLGPLNLKDIDLAVMPEKPHTVIEIPELLRIQMILNGCPRLRGRMTVQHVLQPFTVHFGKRPIAGRKLAGSACPDHERMLTISIVIMINGFFISA